VSDLFFSLHPLSELFLDPPYLLQGLVPSSFKFLRDQAVLGISGIEPLLRTARGVLCRLQIPLERGNDLATLLCLPFARQDRCLYRCWLNDAQYLTANGFIGGYAPKSDASWLPVVEKSAPTRVSQHIVLVARVTYCQLMTAAPTTQESS
jgi:hypothetical protein